MHLRRSRVLGRSAGGRVPVRRACAGAGRAAGGVVVEDAAWCYERPFPEAAAVTGLLCFDETRVSIVHDIPPAR